MADLLVGTIAFNVPWAIEEQIRLFEKNLQDEHELRVYDNSSDNGASERIKDACGDHTAYIRLGFPKHEHHFALNAAASDLLASGIKNIGLVDHDVFPARETSLVPFINGTGFYGIGQHHGPTGKNYLFPGFIFFSRKFVAGRRLDFNGIRGAHKRDDGDTGSGLWPLFEGESWEKMFRGKHNYGYLREPDNYGLQSFGYEMFEDGGWIHLTNTSGWMHDIPEPGERERLARELIAKL